MSQSEIIRSPLAGNAGEVSREEFGADQLEVRAETSSTAVAAHAKAAVEAGFIVAFKRPRDINQVRVKLMTACARPRFAEACWYHVKVGRKKNEKTGQWEDAYADGLSIRFAEEAARNLGNLRIDAYMIYDDPRKRIVKFVTVDLETNTEWGKTITIDKVVERAELRKGQQALWTRTNSYGEIVYVVDATPDELRKLEASYASKAWRDQILKNLPADIKEECLEQAQKTKLDQAAKDPEGEKKKIFDAFATIGIEPVHLREYLEHDLATVSPAEIVQLRGVYTAIKDGATNWAEVMEGMGEEKPGPAAAGKPAEKPPVRKGQTNLTDAAAQAKAKREAAKPAATPPPAAAGATAATTPPPAAGAPPPIEDATIEAIAVLAEQLTIDETDACRWVGKTSYSELDQAMRVFVFKRLQAGGH